MFSTPTRLNIVVAKDDDIGNILISLRCQWKG